MQLMKTIHGLIGLTVTAGASSIIHTEPIFEASDITSYGNFSDWCGNITPYGSSTSTIHAWCGNGSAGASLLYLSHIDLNQCITNNNGQISGATNGNAMHSCKLGPNGHNACANCNGAWFDFNCKTGADGVNSTSTVNLGKHMSK